MATEIFCFYLQNRLIQTSQTGDQWYGDSPPLVFPGSSLTALLVIESFITLAVDGGDSNPGPLQSWKQRAVHHLALV
jgi:hypothetical protein